VRRCRVGRLDELQAGQLKLVEADGTPVVLARVGDEVFACHDECTHQGGPLSEGRLSGARLACPWHGWMYDVRSGECVMPARGARVASYPVTVEHGEIWVEVP
jgi:nitrite reductase/ring-hydroxylating ferredoxin subunit